MQLLAVLLSLLGLPLGMFAAPAMTHAVLRKKYSDFLADAGDDAEALQQLKDSELGFCSTLTKRYCVVGALALALAAAALSAGVDLHEPIQIAGLLLRYACLFLLLVVLFCDLKARVIPQELCVIIALIGALSMFTSHGLPALVGGFIAAILIEAIVLVACVFAKAVGPKDALGGGDLKLIPAVCICTGWAGSFAGAMCCSLFMAVCAVVMLITSRNRNGYLPMAPGLFIWFVVGYLTPP